MYAIVLSSLCGVLIAILLRDEPLWVRVSVAGLAGLLVALLFP